MSENIRVLIVDDHAVVREGLRSLIGYEPGLELVGEAQDGIEAMFKAREQQPDVMLLDGDFCPTPQKGSIQRFNKRDRI